MLKQKNLLLIIALLSFIMVGCRIANKDAHLEDGIISVTAPVSENVGWSTNVEIRNIEVPSTSTLATSKSINNAKLIRGNNHFSKLAKANIDNVFIHGFKSDKTIALTFDDGPEDTIMPKLLDILKHYNVKASFFVIGNRVDNAPEVLKRACEEGHLILNHSYTHPEFKKLDNDTIKKEIKEDEDKIFSVIGKRPAIVRPPYGSVDQRVVDAINELGYKTALWSIDTLDWQHMDKAKTVNSVMESVKIEDIVLMHTMVNNPSTLEAVPEIIENLTSKGFKFVTIDEMLQIKAYK